jgi:hypothetical protein
VTSTEAAVATSPQPANENEEESTMRIRLTIGDAEAKGTLLDNETARDFASLLPVTLEMHDLLGREKPGRLPRRLSEGGEPQFTYEVGDLGYWPPAHDVAIFYANDGETIPSPGIIPLGRITSGLDTIASAGDAFEMTIERLD